MSDRTYKWYYAYALRKFSKKQDTALIYILKGLLVPYSDANIKLSFKPNLFFNDLERISNNKKQTIRNAYYKAIKHGLIEIGSDEVPRLTDKGRRKIKPYKPKYLGKAAKLIVIFDIPETEGYKRRHLRLLLRELSFEQIQKSVWGSSYDHRKYLKAEILEYGLDSYVEVYESRKINIL